MVLDFWKHSVYGLGVSGGGTRHEQARGMHCQRLNDRGHLLRRLALREDDLRKALAQAAVVVELGESEVLVGERAKARLGVADRQRAVCDLAQQLFEGLLFDGSRLL